LRPGQRQKRPKYGRARRKQSATVCGMVRFRSSSARLPRLTRDEIYRRHTARANVVTRPLKFLLISIFYPPHSFGGDAVFTSRLARALADEGHRVDVVHCLDSYFALHSAHPEQTLEAYPNVTVHGLQSGFGTFAPMLSHQTGRTYLRRKPIEEIIERSAPDVIHYHNVSLFGPEVLTLGSRAGRALKVYTTHEYWLVCPMHVLWKFNSRPCEKPECVRCMLLARRPPQLWRYSGMLNRVTDAVDLFLAPSRSTAKIHAERGFTRPMRYLPSFAEPAPAGLGENPHPRPYFLFVGRLFAGKGVRSLVNAWSKTSVDADLLIVGEGPEAARLRRMASGDPRIHFLGYKTQAELSPYYAHCLACIVPSQMYEVFTLVVLEAFIHQAPVIVWDQGPLREMIEDSGGGLLYRTEEELLAAVDLIARDSAIRNEMGDNGFRMVSGEWSKATHLKNYFALIREASLRKFGGVPWEK